MTTKVTGKFPTAANSLVKYDAARKALAAAHRVDEVKNIRDKAVAMQAYAQAGQGHDPHHPGDRDQDARRAPRWRTPDRNGRPEGARNERRRPEIKVAAATLIAPKLADLGINKTQSPRAGRSLRR